MFDAIFKASYVEGVLNFFEKITLLNSLGNFK